VVTAFSTFFDVTANPTEQVLRWLEKEGHPPGHHTVPGTHQAYTLHSYTVLKVAAREVDSWLHTTTSNLEAGLPTGTPVVLLHLGLALPTPHMKLEAAAYNNASFRAPDECGWQPKSTPIDASCDLDTCSECLLDVGALAQQLSCESCPVAVSYDPGRFVCNYTYYRSLSSTRSRRHWFSLFVHVPPFSNLDEGVQRRFVVQLLQQVAAAAAAAADPDAAPGISEAD